MTIRRGEAWGEVILRPAQLAIAKSDTELAALVSHDRRRPYGVAGGDVFRTVGTVAATGDVHRLSFDALEVRLDDGPPILAVAHVVARNGWWRGPMVAVLNCEQVGEWNVAPRAHPNDGRFDVVEVDAALSLRARWQARSRLPSGTHVPHPAIRTRTAVDAAWAFPRPTRVWIDGVAVQRADRLAVTIRPDHFSIVV